MGKSSRDKRDIYYRLAKENKWRARSAFKLMQIDDEFKILEGVTKAVDLCAAPGSWSQVLSKRIYEVDENAKIVAVDLQPMAPIPGIIQLQGDITSMETANKIIGHFSGEKSDIVICDGAPDVTGIHCLDEFMQSELILAAINITCHVLKPDGHFLAKIFRSRNSPLLYGQMKKFFKDVYLVKPRSSRQSSCEAFILGKHFIQPSGEVLSSLRLSVESNGKVDNPLTSFVTCGDLSGWDSEKSYLLDIMTSYPKGSHNSSQYEFHDVVQPPTEPAYKEALKLKKDGVVSKVLHDIEKKERDEHRTRAQKHQRQGDEGDFAGITDEQVEAMSDLFQSVV